jgi:ParB family chromosome partitioning protein
MGQNKGKIVVEFSTIDDLERIVAVISPEAVTQTRPAKD